MISTLKDSLIYGKIYCAIEHSFNEEGNDIFFCLLISKNKNELIITKEETFHSIEKVISFLKNENQKHIVLIINNNQVLSKKITLVDTQEIAFKSSFSTLSREDFYTQIYNSNEETFISITRKSFLDTLIEKYSTDGISVLDFSIDSLSLNSISDIIVQKEIFTSNSKISLFDHQIKNITSKQYTSQFYDVNGLKIENKYILGLSTIVNFHLLKSSFQTNIYSEFKDKKIFQLIYKTALITLFVVLLINFLTFNSYYNKTNTLNQRLLINKDTKQKFSELKNDLDKKKRLLNELQNSTSVSVSKYIDQIALNIPKSLTLGLINYQPLTSTLKKDKEVTFSDKIIEIKGTLKNNMEFSNWVDEMEVKDWIENISINSIEKNLKKKNSNFHLLITLK